MKVCIDPGHGMSNASSGVFDPGAVAAGVGTREADVALKYGLTLRDVLRENGVKVFMTRDDNEDHAPVDGRALAAKSAGCDILLSIHMNSADSGSAHGTETLFRDGDDKSLAQGIQVALLKSLGLKDRGLKSRPGLAVLKFPGPAVLMELGFITNDGDRAKILQPHVRLLACEAVAAATMEHMATA